MVAAAIKMTGEEALMKTVILCGGRGTRLGEHGVSVPKALIEIGGRPILWHLLKLYAHHGLNDFVLCLGHLGDSIKRYFLEHHWLYADFTLEMSRAGDYHLRKHLAEGEDWRLTFAETGTETNTGGRLKRVAPYIPDDDFCVTYGDGLSDIDLRALIDFHRAHGRIATLTAVNPRSSFGLLSLEEDGVVTEFREKPAMREWINGGFFVFNRRIFDYLEDDSVLEREPLERLARERELIARRHTGFWKCLDTYKDNLEFNQLWDAGRAAWKVWE
jgi:glucose-1-phosphate cytidylyltransferase